MSERIFFSCSSGSSPSFYFTFLPTRYVCTCSRERPSARSVLDPRPRRFEICRRAGALVRKLWRYSTGVYSRQVECCSVVALAALAALAALRSAVARQLRQASKCRGCRQLWGKRCRYSQSYCYSSSYICSFCRAISPLPTLLPACLHYTSDNGRAAGRE